jgi:hypothetical protein
VRELTGDQSPKSFLLQHNETSLDERPVAMQLLLSRLSYVADGVPPNCNQSDQGSICKDGNHSVVLLLQQDFMKDDR